MCAIKKAHKEPRKKDGGHAFTVHARDGGSTKLQYVALGHCHLYVFLLNTLVTNHPLVLCNEQVLRCIDARVRHAEQPLPAEPRHEYDACGLHFRGMCVCNRMDGRQLEKSASHQMFIHLSVHPA